MIKYRYTMRITAEKLADLVEAAIGRRPDELGKSGLHTFSFTFKDTDITQGERQLALDSMPEWIRLVYSFNRDIILDEEV